MAFMTPDLTGYFDRVNYRGFADPTLDVLQDLVTAHTQTIPFENLDPLLGVSVDDLSPEALTDKAGSSAAGWLGSYLVDVGFGGQTPTSPIRIETGSVQQTTHEPYRLEDRGDGLVLQPLIRGEWQALYQFTTRTRPQIDLKVGSWFVSTHPWSHFVTSLTVALVIGDARWNLAGRNLAIHRDGGTEKIRLDDAAAVVETLSDRLGINVANVGERSPSLPGRTRHPRISQ
jgi:arylamine N-acetyltransferase